MFVHALEFLLISALVYYVPGRLLCHLIVKDLKPEESLPFSMGLGLVTVIPAALIIVGLTGIFVPISLTWWVVAVSAAGVAGITLLLLRMGGRLATFRPFSRPTRMQGALWGLAAIMTGLFLVLFDSAIMDEDSCTIRAATAVHHPYDSPEHLSPGVEPDDMSEYHRMASTLSFADGNRLAAPNQVGQRLGPTALLAPFMSLFGLFGFRLVYALQGLLLPGLAFCLGRRLTGRTWGGGLAAVLLTLSPYAIEVQMFDENFISSCFGTLALALLLRSRPSFVGAGLALGLFLGIRHVGVVLLPFVFLYVWYRSDRSWLEAGRFAAALLAGSLPYIMMHVLVFLQTGDLFEGASGRPSVPHSLMGMDFSLNVVLNWPFVESPLRSPYMAYPPLLAFPLDFIRRFGFVLVALLPLGSYGLWRRSRLDALLLAGWFLPFMALLMVQSNWVEPDKMGIPATVLAPAVLAMCAGAVSLLQKTMTWIGRAAWMSAGIAIPAIVATACGDLRLERDDRVFAATPDYIKEIMPESTVLRLPETEAFVELDRARYRPSPWPSVHLGGLHPSHLSRRAAQLARELESPAVEHYTPSTVSMAHRAMMCPDQYMGPLSVMRDIRQAESGSTPRENGTFVQRADPGEEPSMCVRMSLDSAPSVSLEPLVPAECARDGRIIDLTTGEVFKIRDIEVPWSAHPITLVAGRTRLGTVFMSMGPVVADCVDSESKGPGGIREIRGSVDARGPLLKVPQGSRLILSEIRSIVPNRFYRRYAVLDPDRVWVSAPLPTTH